MDNENNQLSDIDAGKLNFQPIPKRFMVWDKGNQKFMYFIDDDGYERFMVDISELYVLIEEYGYSYEDVVIIQSTNLFDKDGKEIFEASIVEWGSDIGAVELYKGKWTFHIVDEPFDVYHELFPNADMVKVVGHIFSNPELLRRNNHDDN